MAERETIEKVKDKRARKAKTELKLDEVAYEATDKFTGRIVVDPQDTRTVLNP